MPVYAFGCEKSTARNTNAKRDINCCLRVPFTKPQLSYSSCQSSTHDMTVDCEIHALSLKQVVGHIFEQLHLGAKAKDEFMEENLHHIRRSSICKRSEV